MSISKLQEIARAATHIAVDPDDMTGFTDDCFKAFCIHYGYGYPVEENYKHHAQTLWNETPGDAWRSAWLAGVQYPISTRLIEKLLAEVMAGREFERFAVAHHWHREDKINYDKAREALDAEASLV